MCGDSGDGDFRIYFTHDRALSHDVTESKLVGILS